MNMQKKPKRTGIREPEVFIIYVHEDEMHMTGAHLTNGEWSYSKWLIRPKSELHSFKAECLKLGMFVLDVRHLANLRKPGMGSATPVLIANNGVDIQLAVEAMAKLHTAILNESTQS